MILLSTNICRLKTPKNFYRTAIRKVSKPIKLGRQGKGMTLIEDDNPKVLTAILNHDDHLYYINIKDNLLSTKPLELAIPGDGDQFIKSIRYNNNTYLFVYKQFSIFIINKKEIIGQIK